MYKPHILHYSYFIWGLWQELFNGRKSAIHLKKRQNIFSACFVLFFDLLCFSCSHIFFFSYFQSVEALMNTYERELRLAEAFIFSTLLKRTQFCWALRWTLGWFCVKNSQIVIRKWRLSFLNVSLQEMKGKNKTKQTNKHKNCEWVLRPAALGRLRRIGWRGRWEQGIGMGNTCISKADSCQCMTKTTTIL